MGDGFGHFRAVFGIPSSNYIFSHNYTQIVSTNNGMIVVVDGVERSLHVLYIWEITINLYQTLGCSKGLFVRLFFLSQ